jgi:hypothetical protein
MAGTSERCRELNPELPVVYATGYSLQKPRLVPGSRLLHKPYELAQVVGTLCDLLGRRGPPA